MSNYIGAIRAMGPGSRYRTYQDNAGCSKCGEGATWGVLDTIEDILIGGISYHKEEDAEWLADQLNDAAESGRSRAKRYGIWAELRSDGWPLCPNCGADEIATNNRAVGDGHGLGLVLSGAIDDCHLPSVRLDAGGR